jgi:serine phosphatase RsbU (regulator of sigma subunit)
MKLFFFLFFFIFCLAFFAFAQKQDIDSLNKALAKFQTMPKFESDTNYINTLNILAFKYRTINADTTLILAEKTKELAERNRYEIGKIEAIKNIGIFYDVKGNYAKAAEYFLEALFFAEKINYQKGIGSLYNNVANIYHNEGKYTEALDMYFKALKITEKIGDKQEIAYSLNNIGNIYQSQEKYKDALINYFKSLKIREEMGNKQGISRSLNNIANVYEKEDKLTDALEYNLLSLKIKKEISDKRGIAASLNNIANIYVRQEKYKEALAYYLQSLEIKIEIGDKRGIAYSKNGLAKTYLALKDYKQALLFAEEGLQLSQKIGEKEEIRNMNEILSNIYEATNTLHKALYYHKQFKIYADSLNNKETEKKTAILQAEYKYSKKLAAIETEQIKKDLEQKTTLQAQRFQRDALITGFIVLFIIALLILRNLRKEKKAKMLLQVKNIEILNQKAEIEQAKEEITMQSEEILHTHTKLQDAFKILNKKNQNIIASINTAKRIQDAMLPNREEITRSLPEHFILFMPRDIVSGDFYWFANKGDKTIIAVSDCTGHGIPGALLSMIGINILDEIVNTQDITSPEIILETLHKHIHYALQHEKTDANEGMDIAIIAIEKSTIIPKLEFSGAMNALYYVQNGNLFEIKGTKKAIGGQIYGNIQRVFEKHSIEIYSQTIVYMCSDGYQDQFGGIENYKFMSKKLKKLLLEISNQDFKEQEIILKQTIDDWMAKGNRKQVDDITIFGLKIKV